MAAIDDFISNCTERMNKSVETTHEHFNGVRTGRALAALLDRIQVDYYVDTPRRSRTSPRSTSPEARMLTIQPFDPSSIKQIERAIQEANLGLTPSWNDGKIIRLPIPPADRGAAQGVREAGAEHGRGGGRHRRAQRAP